MPNKQSIHSIDRAGLRERLHFLFTGEIPNYWYKANMDVRMTLVQALADPEFPFCKEHKNKPEMLNNVIDFLVTTKFSYQSVEKYVNMQRRFPHESKIPSDNRYPDYFPKPSDATKKCPRIGMPSSTMKIFSTPCALKKHLIIRNKQAIEKTQ